MRLLLVEDDPHLGPAMRRALEADRYAVDLAATAEDASAMARVHAYGVVLLDLGLPDGSGLEVLRHLLSQFPLGSRPLLESLGHSS